MTHVWPVFGEAPVPSTVSSYWRPEGVVFIFDSFLSAATAGFAVAGFSSARAGSARETAKEHARRIFEIRIELSLSFIESFRAAQFTAASRKSRTPRVARRRPSSLGRSVSSRGLRWAESRGCAARRLGDERERGRFVHQADLAFRALSRGRVEIDPAFEDDAMEVRDERSGVARRVGTPCRGIVLAHPLEEQAWATLPVEDGALVRAIVRPVVGNADLGVREKELADERVEGEPVPRAPFGVNERRGRAVEEIPGDDLLEGEM